MDCPICTHAYNQTDKTPESCSKCGNTICELCHKISSTCPYCKSKLPFVKNRSLCRLLDSQKCIYHKRIDAIFYCKTDCTLLCADCLLPEHINHNIGKLDTVRAEASRKRKHFEELLDTFDKKREALDTTEKDINLQIDYQTKTVLHLFKEYKNRLISLLEQKRFALSQPFLGDKSIKQIAELGMHVIQKEKLDKDYVTTIETDEHEFNNMRVHVESHGDTSEVHEVMKIVNGIFCNMTKSFDQVKLILEVKEVSNHVDERMPLPPTLDNEILKKLFSYVKADSLTIISKMQQYGYPKAQILRVSDYITQNALRLGEYPWFKSGYRFAF